MRIKRIELPQTDGVNTEEKISLILGYLSNLQNDLRYMLSNLEGDNLGKELYGTIEEKSSVGTGTVLYSGGEFSFPEYKAVPKAVLVFSKNEGGGVWCALKGFPCTDAQGSSVLAIGEKKITFSPSLSSQRAEEISPLRYMLIT